MNTCLMLTLILGVPMYTPCESMKKCEEVHDGYEFSDPLCNPGKKRKLCDPGSYYNNSDCSLADCRSCPANTFQPVKNNCTECAPCRTSCPEGQVTVGTCSGEEDTKCINEEEAAETCIKLEDENGVFNCSDGYNKGSQCNLTCNEGFKANVTSSTCNTSLQWTQLPKCEEILCPSLSPDQYLCSNYNKVGSECTIKQCEDGFALLEITSASCNADGNWTDPLLCVGVQSKKHLSTLLVILLAVICTAIILITIIIIYCVKKKKKKKTGTESKPTDTQRDLEENGNNSETHEKSELLPQPKGTGDSPMAGPSGREESQADKANSKNSQSAPNSSFSLEGVNTHGTQDKAPPTSGENIPTDNKSEETLKQLQKRDYLKLLATLRQNLTSDEIRNIAEHFPELSREDKCQIKQGGAYTLFDLLNKRCALSEDDVDGLLNALSSERLYRLKKLVEAYKDNYLNGNQGIKNLD